MRKRLTRKEKRNRNKKIVITGTICLLFCLCVGYAAFNTELSIRAKGNIKESENCEFGGIKVNTVTEGDGLYFDTYEEGKCTYKGTNPNNYIRFTNELWRIVSTEEDGTIKIIRDKITYDSVFDEANNRTTGYCSNENTAGNGCNVWSSTANMVGSPSEFIGVEHSSDGTLERGTVDKDSTLLTYLNGEYLNSLINNDKIVSYIWNIGMPLDVTSKDEVDLETIMLWEKQFQWNGKIGLLSYSEFRNANSSANTVFKPNYLSSLVIENKSDSFYLISPAYAYNLVNAIGTDQILGVPVYGFTTLKSADSDDDDFIAGIRPCLYLTPNITLSGNGTEQDPYVITN